MIFSLWGFMENAKSGNLSEAGWKHFEKILREMCDIIGIDYDMSYAEQITWEPQTETFKNWKKHKEAAKNGKTS